MQALHDLVKSGCVRYIGMSSCYAYQCKHVLHLAPSFPTNSPLSSPYHAKYGGPNP